MQISGADVVIVDDIVDTAGTLSALSKRLEAAGARNIYACASHGLFTDDAMEMIEKSSVKKVVVTNTLPAHEKSSSKVVQVSVAPMLAHVILAEHFRTVERANERDNEEFEIDELGDDSGWFSRVFSVKKKSQKVKGWIPCGFTVQKL